MYIASVFVWMLHIFHTYDACVLSGCCICVAMVFKCFMCFLQVFQAFYLSSDYVASVVRDVSKVDQVLHLPPRVLLPRLDVSSSSSAALPSSQTTEGAQ